MPRRGVLVPGLPRLPKQPLLDFGILVVIVWLLSGNWAAQTRTKDTMPDESPIKQLAEELYETLPAWPEADDFVEALVAAVAKLGLVVVRAEGQQEKP